MRIADLTIHCIESEMFAENTYTIRRDGQTDCIQIDPGFQHETLIRYLQDEELRPLAILNTHGHSDHIAGNDAIKKAWPDAPLIIGKHDAYKLTDPDANLSAPFGAHLVSPPADQEVVEGETVRFGDIPFEVLETPGHSKGHVVFLYRGSPNVLIGGDVLFQGSVGRTDFFDGSFEELASSIQNKLFALDPETVVLPGHGPPTTIGAEIQHNPFVGIPAGFSPG